MDMKLATRDIALITIAESGGCLRGKTLLQKKVYFLEKLLEKEARYNLDVSYRPHLYGPYAPGLESALGELKGLRFVEERQSSFGLNEEGYTVKRYDYHVTEDGKVLTDILKKRHPDEYDRIVQAIRRIGEAGNLDYVSLSVAAKTYHILSTRQGPMTRQDVIDFASGLNWKISEEQLQVAAEFLEKLGLINVNQTT